MISPAHGLLGIVAAVAAAIPSHQPVAPVAGGDPNPVAPVALISSRTYKATDKEFYLASDQVGYIRPGLKLKLNSITIPADRKPVVDLSFTDDFDQPLDRAGKATPGAISFSFVLSWYDATARQYTSYATRRVTSPITNVTTNQAAADSGGTFRDVEMGTSSTRSERRCPRRSTAPGHIRWASTPPAT